MSTAGEVAICNAALTKIGAERITALDSSSARSRLLRERYPQIRDAELHRHLWKFSVKRVALAALASAPASDYARQFQLPADYLRLINGGDIADYVDLSDFRGAPGSALYSIEGQRLLTDLSSPLNIRYIARVTDTALFNPSFAEALAARIAMEICKRVTDSDTGKDVAIADYRLAVREALRASAIEAPPDHIADDTWIMGRLQ